MIINLSYDDVIKKIKEKGLSEEEIRERVQKKLDELSGLISKEGAAYLIANELGIKIFEDVGEIKIKDVIAGMRNVDVVGKLISVNDVREFKKENREGKVGSFLISDETRAIRIVLWDENHIKRIENNELKEGAIVRIKNAYARDNSGFMELHLNNKSNIEVNPEGVKIEKVVSMENFVNNIKKKIVELSENDRNVELKGTIVQLFDPRFYEICKECGRRVRIDNDFKCTEHNSGFEYAAVVNFFLDDGSENIRVVCFRDQTGNALGLNVEEVLQLRENPGNFEILKGNILGRQIKVIGRVVKNTMFDRLEFVANFVEELNPENLIKELEENG